MNLRWPRRWEILRRYHLPVRRFLSARTPWFYTSMALLLLTGVSFLYLAWFLVDLVWEPEMGVYFSRLTLMTLLFLPAWLLVVLLIMLGKTLLDWMTRREGTRMRSRLVLNFALVTLLPSLILVGVFDRLLNASLEVFFRNAVVEAMDNSLALLKDNVARIQGSLGRILVDLSTSPVVRHEEGAVRIDTSSLARLLGGTEADLFAVYEGNQRIYLWSHRGDVARIKGILDGVRWTELPWESSTWGHYRLNEDIILRARQVRGGRFLVLVSLPAGELSPRVAGTVDAIRRFKQFQILREPLRGSLLILYLYFYVPVLALGLLFFFYTSNQITRPVGRLQMAAARIARGDFGLRVDGRGSDDEIRTLVNTFNRMARELEQNRDKLRHMDRMEVWRSVAVRLAHEIKNPLTPIALALDQIEKENRKDLDLYARTVEPFNLIRMEVDHLRRLTQEFGSFSRQGPLEPTWVEARPFLLRFRETLDLHPDIESRMQLDFPPHLRVWADENKIRQVILNLLHNAVDSVTATGSGRVEILSRIEDLPEGPQWCIAVVDNGPGVPPSIRERIFQPYATSKSQGTGLGLVISQELAAAHRGRILWESQPGRTRFEVQIPLNPA